MEENKVQQEPMIQGATVEPDGGTPSQPNAPDAQPAEIGAGGFGTELFDALRFPGVVRAPGYDDPEWLPAALSLLAEHGEQLAAVVVEPLVQGAAGMQMTSPEAVAALGRACREAGCLLICGP